MSAEIKARTAKICPIALTQKAAEMGTVICKLLQDENDRLFRYGFKVADGFRCAY